MQDRFADDPIDQLPALKCGKWAINVKQQCKAADVPFFFKQWGVDGVRRSKAVNGRELKGRTWDQMPAFA